MADKLLSDIVSSNTYCWLFYNSLGINFIYQGIDGIGISVIRLLYIRKGTWVKYNFGEFKLLYIVALFNVMFTGVMIYGHSIENISTRSVYNTCMGHNEKFQVC
jgi:hypothetical protein